MDLQGLADALGSSMRSARSNYHLTLGVAIEALSEAPSDFPVCTDLPGQSPGRAHSYRGYYSDLAFEPQSNAITAGDFLKVLRDALDATFTGYKGGDFAMDAKTPLWLSHYGTASGVAIIGMDITDDGLVLVTKQVD